MQSVKSSGSNRFQFYEGSLILVVCMCTVVLLVFPFSSQTLQFMNENGIANIYLIVLSYMFAPNTEIDADIIVDGDGNVKGSPTSFEK